jgi:hypothetical protein
MVLTTLQCSSMGEGTIRGDLRCLHCSCNSGFTETLGWSPNCGRVKRRGIQKFRTKNHSPLDCIRFSCIWAGFRAKGYKSCPICMEDTKAEYAQCLHKIVYMGHRRYLGENHRWRHARRAFNGQQQFRTALRRQNGEEIKQKAEAGEEFLQSRGVPAENENLPNDPVKDHLVKRRSRLFDLPYWEVRSKFNLCSLFQTLRGCICGRQRYHS